MELWDVELRGRMASFIFKFLWDRYFRVLINDNLSVLKATGYRVDFRQ